MQAEDNKSVHLLNASARIDAYSQRSTWPQLFSVLVDAAPNQLPIRYCRTRTYVFERKAILSRPLGNWNVLLIYALRRRLGGSALTQNVGCRLAMRLQHHCFRRRFVSPYPPPNNAFTGYNAISHLHLHPHVVDINVVSFRAHADASFFHGVGALPFNYECHFCDRCPTGRT